MRRGDIDGLRPERIVASGIGLEHLGVDVGAQEQLVGAVGAQRQDDLALLDVGFARRQNAKVRRARQHHIVGVAVNRIAAEHQPVAPLTGGAGVALVGDRPAHRDSVAAARTGRCLDCGRRQIGVLLLRHQQRGGRGVVAFVGLGDLPVVVQVDVDTQAPDRRQTVG